MSAQDRPLSEEELVRAYGARRTEEQLQAAYAATGTPVEIHTGLLDALEQLRVIREELAAVRELVDTLLGIATGEVQVFQGEVVDLDKLTCPACRWVASHADDCPLDRPQ